MIRLDLVCSKCKRSFQVEATALRDEEKRCPECGSDSTRQTFASYLRNGPLLDPKWGCAGERSGFG
jgi:DNA-directed RNA polymerase subunit RPC12/RpoP